MGGPGAPLLFFLVFMAESATHIRLPNARGEELAGRLDVPADGRVKAYVLFAHCFAGSKDIPAASRIARALTDHGFGVMRIDFTGLGQSGGDFVNTTFTSNIDDLLAAAHWLATHRDAPAILIGHSLGGAAVLTAARRIPGVRGVATIGAPSEPDHVLHLLAGHDPELLARDGHAPVQVGGRELEISRDLLDDLKAQSLEGVVRDLGCSLLIFHAPGDVTVGLHHAGLLFRWARHPKSFVSLSGADHMLTDRRDAAYVASVLAAWSSRFLEDRK